ncbi:MAG: potassium channel family protein [Candidatus Villigracilaceae bacterium]
MFVIIAGGGRTGAQLATLLLAGGYQVRLIEHRHELLAHLHRELPTEVIYQGLAIDPQVLEHAGIRQANVLAATTDTDANNLLLCYIAREMFKVPRTIARINNPRNAWLFDEKFHVDVALNQANLLAHLIQEEMSLGDMMTLLKLRRGEFSLIEEKVHPTAMAVGKSLRDLELPSECTIVAIIRKNEMIIPRGDTILQPTDEIVALVHHSKLKELSRVLDANRK